MIRLFLLAAGFLSVTIALLVSQMGEPEDDVVSGEATRAGSSLIDVFDDSARTDPLAKPMQATPAREPSAPDTGSMTQIDVMTRSILAELRKPVTGDRLRQVASASEGRSDTMRNVTQDVLAGLETNTSQPEIRQNDVQSPNALNALIVQAMREGQSDAYVDTLINEAVGQGRVDAPASLVTSSGEVDTATLLDSLVQQSMSAQSAPAAAPVVTAQEGELTYVVQPGDSLAGIALRHFGTTTAHGIIFSANRDILPTPAAIKPGMTLRIPSL